MKTKILNFRIALMRSLLIGLCCFFATSLNAQGPYVDRDGNITGTDDSRLVASIEETDLNVTIKVFGIGQMRTTAVEYPLFLKEDVLALTDKTFSLTVPYGQGVFVSNPPPLPPYTAAQEQQLLFRQAIEVSPYLKKDGGRNVEYSDLAGNYRQAGAAINNSSVSSIAGFDAFIIPIQNATSNSVFLETEPGEMVHFFTVYLNKKNPNTPIQKGDFGIGAKTYVGVSGAPGGAFSPKWTGESGYAIYYKYTTPSSTKFDVVPELFYFRSASSVKTENATAVAITTATLNGSFKRGALSPAADLLDGENGVETHTGKLDWDNISRRGFFYSTSAVNLRVDEFSNILFVDDTPYTFPSDTEIAGGTFTRGSYTFSVKSAANSETGQSVTYSESLTGLAPATQYYAWAFTKATFQTSNPFPNIGERITFTTDPACMNPAAPGAAANQNFCPGAKVSDLVATVAPGTTLYWYLYGETTALDPIDELTSTVYYAKAVDGACTSQATEVTVTVKQLSTASMITLTASPQESICSGETATLTASAASVTNPVFKWYASETGTTVLETGPSFITPALTVTTTYWVSVSNATAYCDGEANATGRKSITITIKPASTASMISVTASQESICSGETATLTASAAGVTSPVFKWYASETSTTVLETGPSFVTPALTTTTTYWVSVSNTADYCDGAANSTGRKSITVTVKPASTASMISITASQGSICSGETATLTASAAGVTSPVFKWYASETSTTVLETGPSFVTPALTATTTYWVSVSNSTAYCDGEANSTGRKSITVTVKPYSTTGNLNITGNLAICDGKSTTLTAAATGVTNPSYKWYSVPSGGTPFHQEASYTTGSLTANTTFHVSVSGDNYCEGTVRNSVEVTVSCNTIHGTVFPLITYGEEEIDALFAITAKLYAVPPIGETWDPIGYILRGSSPLIAETTAVPYDGIIHVPGTPQKPGNTGSLVNPGDSINWAVINKYPIVAKDTTTVRPGQKPETPFVGLFSFTDIPLGEYVLVLSRAGFLSRYTKITVGSGGTQFIKHRELIGGDINGDAKIDIIDINAINNRAGYGFGSSNYDARYDTDGNLEINTEDVSLVKGYQGFHVEGYQDTADWIKPYRE